MINLFRRRCASQEQGKQAASKRTSKQASKQENTPVTQQHSCLYTFYTFFILFSQQYTLAPKLPIYLFELDCKMLRAKRSVLA